MSKLMLVSEFAELYPKLSPLDTAVMVTDAEGVVIKFVESEGVGMKVKLGVRVPAEGAVGQALSSQKVVTKILSKEHYGVPIKVIAIPIFEDSNMIGVISAATSLVAQETLIDAAQTIAATSEEITATSEEVAATAGTLASNLGNLKCSTQEVTVEVKKSDEILRFVSDVAANSNLLGLNAAIEAARAGEHGRGFAVVADEIRKMADNCSGAVKDIKEILHGIQNKSNDILNVVDKTSELAERQAAATQEISASMQQLASAASNIEQISKII